MRTQQSFFRTGPVTCLLLLLSCVAALAQNDRGRKARRHSDYPDGQAAESAQGRIPRHARAARREMKTDIAPTSAETFIVAPDSDNGELVTRLSGAVVRSLEGRQR